MSKSQRVEDYGKVYRANDGTLVANAKVAAPWSLLDRADYVHGWEDAEARIATLLLPED